MPGIHDGHRDRMREKFRDFGPGVFHDHELLEMLLYSVIPLRDTNPLAKQLISELGGLRPVLECGRERLMQVPGVGKRVAEFLTDCGRTAAAMSGDYIRPLPLTEPFDDYDALGRNIAASLADCHEYCVYLLLFDNSMHLLDINIMNRCDFGSAAIHPSAFADAAVRAGAAAAVIAHTHPYGPTFPSDSDRESNNAVAGALFGIGVTLVEHYIISGGEYVGMIYHLSEFGKKKNRSTLCANDERMIHDMLVHPTPCTDITYSYPYVLRALLYVMRPEAAAFAAERVSLAMPHLPDLVSGDMYALSELIGLRAAVYIRLLPALRSRSLGEGFRFGVRHSEEEIKKYLVSVFFGESEERVCALLYDGQDRVMSRHGVGEGIVNSSVILARKLVEICRTRRAAGVVIAHNHPNGNTEPSDADIATTGRLIDLLATCGTRLIAHYIVAGDSVKKINLPER